jgi:hypothetical protein
MSNKINYRRAKNKSKVDRRYENDAYHNGYARTQSDDRYHDGELMNPDGVDESQSHGNGRVGRTGYLDKSMHGWSRKSQLADVTIAASIGNDFCNGHSGMARAVKGAKKFVRTRIRFHENAAVRSIMNNLDEKLY